MSTNIVCPRGVNRKRSNDVGNKITFIFLLPPLGHTMLTAYGRIKLKVFSKRYQYSLPYGVIYTSTRYGFYRLENTFNFMNLP